jgi:4-amino-4-deoxy-L-arabinose transferase-like glycosyltransferase
LSDDRAHPGGLVALLSRRWWLIVPVLVLTGLAAWLPGLATIPPVDRDEPRYAQASKQMLESGDYIDIRLQEEPRHKKPVGIHWLQVAAAATVGDGAASPIWVYRLPSLVGALAAVLLTAAIGAAMFDRATGLLAGLAMATSLILSVEAHLAKTDAVLLAFVVLAQWAFWQIWSKRDDPAGSGRWWAVFWIAQALAVLTKMPIAPAVSGLTALILVAWERRIDWLLRFRPLFGPLLLLVIAAPWFVAVGIVTDGDFYRHAWGVDILGKIHEGQEGHGAPPGSYLVALLVTGWPFAALVPLAVVWAWRRRHEDAPKFLIAWVVGFWVVMEAAVTKLPHYTLPTYPALAIAASAAVLALDRRRPWLVGLPLAVVILLGAALAGGVFVVPALLDDALPAAAALGALAALGFLSLTWRDYARGCHQRAGLAGIAAALLLYAAIYGGLFPRMEALALSPRMAEAARLHAPCDEPVVASIGYHEPSAVFEIGTDLGLTGTAEAAELLAAHDCTLVFVPAARLDALRAAADPVLRELTRLEGWQINGGDWITLVLVTGAAE